MAVTATNLSSVAPILLPPQIADPIFLKTTETSAVQQLAREVPLDIDRQTAIPVPMDIPVPGWVAEGQAKPVGGGGVGAKVLTPKKLALLLPVSEELWRKNPAGLYDMLERDLPTGLSRSFDAAAIHNIDLRSGGVGPFGTGLAATPNTVALGTATSAQGGMYTDLWNGVSKVVNAPTAGYDVTGFAADPRLKPELATSVDANGRPFFVDSSFNANGPSSMATLINLPAAFNPGVSGRLYRSGDAAQVVTINGVPTGGTFKLIIGGSSTAAIAFNATAATVQSAIQALNTNVYGFGGSPAGAATVTGGAGGPYTVTFLAGGASAPIYADGSGLTGGTNPSVTVAQTPSTDSGLRAVGGDWSQCAWGIAGGITMRVSNEGGYVDAQGTTHFALQENLVILLIETWYSFAVNDLGAFVSYTHAAGS